MHLYRTTPSTLSAFAITVLLATCCASVSCTAAPRRNVVIFVADGLRAGSVTRANMPTLYALAARGVRFENSHSLFPTVTMPNSSAIATGHCLGDTGIRGNVLFIGRRSLANAPTPGALAPAIENDEVEGDIDELYVGSLLGEETLLAAARKHGYNTAAIGKLGPTLMQDVSQGALVNGVAQIPQTIFIDDSTGRRSGIPLSPAVLQALAAASLPAIAPDRSNGSAPKSQQSNGYTGNSTKPGTLAANTVQQQYFVDALTHAVLPQFKAAGKPFVVVYWSRDPDGTQHNQGDSLGALSPGVNGPTSLAALRNADTNLAQILDALKQQGLINNTDIFVTSDHGFNTISKREIDNHGGVTKSYAASITYRDATGRQDVPTGSLPPGFLAIDLAHALGLKLYDTDAFIGSGAAQTCKLIDPTLSQASDTVLQHPSTGSAVLGGSGGAAIPGDAQAAVLANGGADLIYLFGASATNVREQATQIVDFLLKQDYVSGVFVHDRIGKIQGTLPLSTIGLLGSAKLPDPSIVVNFRSFALDPKNPLQTSVLISDTALQEGQGQHGGFDRANTYNFMAASGPDFKQNYVDPAPASNADIAQTLASLLHLALPSRGSLAGRVLEEGFLGHPNANPKSIKSGYITSSLDARGAGVVLRYVEIDGRRYFDAAGSPGRTNGL
ncbi:MAG: alkaline phosphatase family protein [Capsulimonadaceae bacterium]|nr:alkaline phosphatase family protein [Capsulimonadaceae bacterium]